MRTRNWLACGTVVTVLACGVWSCGGDGSPAAPSGGGGGGGTPVETTTITITGTGVSPQSIVIPANARVTFVNNDSRSHEPSSNPHPSHTDCPALNVGNLAPGQTRESQPMPGGRTCGFHDHLFDSDASLRGTVQVR